MANIMFDEPNSRKFYETVYQGIYAKHLSPTSTLAKQPFTTQLKLCVSQSKLHTPQSSIAILDGSPKRKKFCKLKKSKKNVLSINEKLSNDFTSDDYSGLSNYDDLLSGDNACKLEYRKLPQMYSFLTGDRKGYANITRSQSVMDKSLPKKLNMENNDLTTRTSLPDNAHVCKLVKIYLSERQSSNIKECGSEVPCAPPATPTSELLKKFQYVPSMTDIKAQRDVKGRLETIERSNQRLLETKERELIKEELENVKLTEKLKRQRQRCEIYALNKIMTQYEHMQFTNFQRAKHKWIKTPDDFCDIP